MLLDAGKHHLGEQVVPEAFLDALWEGNDRGLAARSVGKDAMLAPNGWYTDQIRVLEIGGHRLMSLVDIHGQTLMMAPESCTVIAINGGDLQAETEQMNARLFLRVVPAVPDATAEKQAM